MTLYRSRLKTLALSGLILAALPQSAFAVDGQEVAKRLKALFETQGVTTSWSGVSGSGDAFTLEGVSLALAGVPGGINVGAVSLSEITEDGDVIVVGELSMPTYAVTQDGFDFKLDGVSIEGLRLHKEGSTDPMAAIGIYDSGDIASMTMAIGGKNLVTMSNLHAEMTPAVDGKPLEFTAAADRFEVDLTTLDDPQTQQITKALGYEKISGEFEMEGTWSLADGRLVLKQNDLSIDNAGMIGLTLDISGYTPAFVKALQDLQAKMAASPGEDQTAQSMAMLGLMQQINLHSASVRFDDDTLTEKVLEFVAAQQGKKPEDIVNQAKAILPFAMAQLNNPELTKAVSEAVNEFLDNPESLEIRVEPEKPLPFAMVAAGAMTAPEALPQALGLRIRANK